MGNSNNATLNSIDSVALNQHIYNYLSGGNKSNPASNFNDSDHIPELNTTVLSLIRSNNQSGVFNPVSGQVITVTGQIQQAVPIPTPKPVQFLSSDTKLKKIIVT